MVVLLVRNREQLTAAFDRLRSNDVTVAELNLHGLDPSLSAAEMETLTEVLEVNTHLETICLRWCLRGVPRASLRSLLVALLSTHPSLKTLNLAWNTLTDVHVWIAAAMKTNTSLKKLHLTQNQIGIEGVRALAEILPVNKTLEELYLSSNSIGDAGCCLIASALVEKSNLKVLNLGDNNIGNVGIIALADGLCKNKSIQTLILSYNSITDEGCPSISKALCRNTSLCVLGLVGNRLTDTGVAALEASLESINYAIETCDTRNNTAVTREQLDRINRLCENNRRIKSSFPQLNICLPVLSLAVWPRALHHVITKPNLVFEVLKSKPDLCRESVIVGRLRRENAELRNQQLQNERQMRTEIAELRTQVQDERQIRLAAEETGRAELQNERQLRLALESELERLRREVAAAASADDDDDNNNNVRQLKRKRQ